MKTAISIQDATFQAAEKLAQELGKSRSQLYTQALEEYLVNHDADEITRKLNEVYADIDSSLDPAIAEMQARSIPREDW